MCPSADGRPATERVESVVTFTGQSLSVPPGSTPILRMEDNAYDWGSRSIRQSARDHAQAIAITFGNERVVILGEAGLLSAQVGPHSFMMDDYQRRLEARRPSQASAGSDDALFRRRTPVPRLLTYSSNAAPSTDRCWSHVRCCRTTS